MLEEPGTGSGEREGRKRKGEAVSGEPGSGKGNREAGSGWAMAGWTERDWPAIEALLDAALDQPAERRLDWLESREGEARIKRAARELLAADAGFLHRFDAEAGSLLGVALEALQVGADRIAADAALDKLVAEYGQQARYQIAQAYALRRDPDHVFQWLDSAWAHRDAGISMLLSDPLILRYRHDPRFAEFCRKAGLPTTTDAVAMD